MHTTMILRVELKDSGARQWPETSDTLARALDAMGERLRSRALRRVGAVTDPAETVASIGWMVSTPGREDSDDVGSDLMRAW